MILADIFKKAYILAGKPDREVISKDDIVSLINEGIKEIYGNTRIGYTIEEFPAQNLTIRRSPTALSYSYFPGGYTIYYNDPNANYIDAYKITNIYYNDKELEYIDYSRYLEEVDKDLFSEPTFWTIKGNEILFYPSISSGNVKVAYYKLLDANYDYDSDIALDVPDQFFRALIYYVAKEIAKLSGNLELGQNLEVYFMNEVRKLDYSVEVNLDGI